MARIGFDTYALRSLRTRGRDVAETAAQVIRALQEAGADLVCFDPFGTALPANAEETRLYESLAGMPEHPLDPVVPCRHAELLKEIGGFLPGVRPAEFREALRRFVREESIDVYLILSPLDERLPALSVNDLAPARVMAVFLETYLPALDELVQEEAGDLSDPEARQKEDARREFSLRLENMLNAHRLVIYNEETGKVLTKRLAVPCDKLLEVPGDNAAQMAAQILKAAAKETERAAEDREFQESYAQADASEKVRRARKWNRFRTKYQWGGRPRIAWFSPMPPQPSGIADYSADMVDALSDYVDVDVYTAENVREYPGKRHLYAETVYQLGNSDMHHYMWPYLRCYGGTAELHDFDLTATFDYYCLHNAFRKMPWTEYYIEDNKGKEGNNAFLLRSADRIIVHNNWSADILRREGVAAPVRVLPHYSAYGRRFPSDREGMMRRTGWRPYIACFGEVGEAKRYKAILRAFAEATRGGDLDENYVLFFGGRLQDGQAREFYRIIREEGLEGRVILAGQMELYDFLAAMADASLCLNLRWPYHGESSGALLRLLSMGKAVIVNDVGSFGEMPDGCCYKISSPENLTEEQEIQEIRDAMIKILTDKEVRDNLEERAETAARDLALGSVAKDYRDELRDGETVLPGKAPEFEEVPVRAREAEPVRDSMIDAVYRRVHEALSASLLEQNGVDPLEILPEETFVHEALSPEFGVDVDAIMEETDSWHYIMHAYWALQGRLPSLPEQQEWERAIPEFETRKAHVLRAIQVSPEFAATGNYVSLNCKYASAPTRVMPSFIQWLYQIFEKLPAGLQNRIIKVYRAMFGKEGA